MTNEQICEYIKHYVEEDRTKSAIMLTAPWGKGKSYFVQNELIPYLEENGNHQSVVVSLYGVDSLTEISKSIYFEIKGFALNKKVKPALKKFEQATANDGIKKMLPELMPAAKIAGRTVIKGLTSFVGIDLSLGNLEELYNSIDLSGKLLVFEDIERSRIDIIEFLGYVNSIVEQDNVKVLLIANEDELIRYYHREIIEGGKKRIRNEYTKSSLQYLKFKEKTVSDTIQFYGDTKNAIISIINQYNCKQFSWLEKGEKLNDLEKLLYVGKIDNLRTFIYACQKTVEIYEQIDEFNLEDNYLECIFYGIILFSRSIKCGIFPGWDGTEYLSSKLTGTGIPLFRFCYDYIRWHMFDKSNIDPTIKAYKDYRMMNQKSDDDITVIINYALSSEADVIAALKNIDKRLNTPFDVPFGMYINLAYYLVKFHFLLNYDFSSIREKMLNNLKNNAQNISTAGLMFAHFEFESNEEEETFGVFKRDIEESIKSSQHYIEKFSYNPSKIDELQKKADSLTQYSHRFISLYNLEKLVDMLFLCNAKQLFSLRAAIRSVYKNASLGQFERDDYKFMEEMLSLISQKKKKLPKNFDRIQLMHIDYLCNDLEEFILQSFKSEKL